MIEAKHSIYYSEVSIEFSDSAIDTLINLAEKSTLVSNAKAYAIYEKSDEWSMAIGCFAEIIITKAKVTLVLDSYKKVYQEENLVDAIYQASQDIPVNNWRLYGCARYEMSHVFYNFSHYIDDKKILGKLFLPEYEIRIVGKKVLLRSIYPEKLNILVDIFTQAVCNSTPDSVYSNKMDDDTIARLQYPSQNNYKLSVKSAIDEINENHYQKVIISRKVMLPKNIDLLRTYHNGRKHNTPARSFLVQYNDFGLAGFSPETLLESDAEGWLSTQPLAGTRALTKSKEENQRLQAELLNDTKELAEHAVSVKLAQEELLSICINDTVKVSEFMSIRERGSVQHLASRVVGKLCKDKHIWNAFETLFPAVTASGIPKKAAIDAIKRHEDCDREWYSGCVFTVDSDNKMDAALTLRAIYRDNNHYWLQAGAGVVDLSTPERELEETSEKLECVIQSVVEQ